MRLIFILSTVLAFSLSSRIVYSQESSSLPVPKGITDTVEADTPENAVFSGKGLTSFKNFPEPLEQALLNTVYDASFFQMPELPASNPPQGIVSEVWMDNKPEFEFDIKDAKLSFGLIGSDTVSFDIYLEYREQSTVIRHSHPGLKRQKGGVRFAKRKNERVAIYEILYGSGARPFVGIYIPKEEENSHDAMLMCFRHPEDIARKNEDGQPLNPTQKTDIRYLPSPYELKAVEVKVEGGFYAKVLSGVQPGKLRGTLSVSKNLAPCDPFDDQAFARDPEIGFDYFPKQNADLVTSVDNPKLFGSGVQVDLDLRNGAGYTRLSTYQKVLWVKEVQLPKALAFGVRQNFDGVNFEAGPCFLVARWHQLEHQYLRNRPPIEESKELN